MDLLAITTQLDDGRRRLALAGDLDLSTAPVLDAAMRGEPRPTVLDLSDVAFIDLAGLAALVRARDAADAELVLDGVSGAVERLLETTRLRRAFEAGAPALA